MANLTTPNKPKALPARPKNKKRPTNTDLMTNIIHPSTTWSINATMTMHTLDPVLVAEDEAVNGPLRERIKHHLRKMTEL